MEGKTVEDKVTNIDTKPPKAFTPGATATDNKITVTGSTTDQEATETDGCSKIKSYEYSKDNGKTWQSSNIFSGVSENTTYQIKMKAIDNAGNETISSTKSITTKIAFKVAQSSITGAGNGGNVTDTSNNVQSAKWSLTLGSLSFDPELFIAINNSRAGDFAAYSKSLGGGYGSVFAYSGIQSGWAFSQSGARLPVNYADTYSYVVCRGKVSVGTATASGGVLTITGHGMTPYAIFGTFLSSTYEAFCYSAHLGRGSTSVENYSGANAFNSSTIQVRVNKDGQYRYVIVGE